MLSRMFTLMFCLCAAVFLGASSVQASAVGPDRFVIYDRLVGEGRATGEMTIGADANVWPEPQFSTILSTVEEGEVVNCLKTQIGTYPRHKEVRLLETQTFEYAYRLEPGAEELSWKELQDMSPQTVTVPAGESIYFMMYTGEGTYCAWYNGMLLAWVQPFHIKNFNAGVGIEAQEPYWGEYLSGEPIETNAWFYIVKADGTVGWIYQNAKPMAKMMF